MNLVGSALLAAVASTLLVLVRCDFDLHDHDEERVSRYTDEWVVHLEKPDKEAADLFAESRGYENMGEIPGFEGMYQMRKVNHSADDAVERGVQTRELRADAKVLYAQPLFHKVRVKRWQDEGRYSDLVASLDSSRNFVSNGSGRSKAYLDAHDRSLDVDANSEETFNDELWDREWYLHEAGVESRERGGASTLNVLPVYEKGITGKGVRVAVLDDGMECRHDDLAQNCDPEICHAFSANNMTGDPDPSPDSPQNNHGTRCAGEIAMVANNRKCGTGVAFNAKIGGIKVLGKAVSDRSEGQSLQFAFDKVDIYCASWGPTDDAKTVEGPGYMATKAILKGITEGRNGLGAIYVWASGNGGKLGDNCNCDGYTSSVYTLSVGAITESGKVPWYAESCASTMTSTFSSGYRDEKKVVTTDTKNGCTTEHTGTSASAPLAAGIIALMLEANPKLGWRDVQHLVVWLSITDTLPQITGWVENAVGLKFHQSIGFGLMDGKHLVENAEKYTKMVGPQLVERYNASFEPSKKAKVGYDDPLEIRMEVRGSMIKHVEHVQVVSNFKPKKRGCLQLKLVSPSGTSCRLLTMRDRDESPNGFKNWAFLSVHFWGENPEGTWTLQAQNGCDNPGTSEVGGHHLLVYGTSDEPPIVKLVTGRSTPRKPNDRRPAAAENEEDGMGGNSALSGDKGAWSDFR